MPASPEFAYLESRCQTIELKFARYQYLAEMDDPVSFIPDIDKLAAYRLLIHSEIEEYLEKKAKVEIARLEPMITAATGARTMLAIYPMAALFDIKLPFELPFDSGAFSTQAKLVLSRAKKYISENNGIKSETLKHVSAILGTLPDEVDPALASALDSYGKNRGEVAHKSVAGVNTILSPSAEIHEVKNLIDLLRNYFKEL